MTKRLSPALMLALLAASPALGAPVSFTVVSPDSYQAFVGNWTPSHRPLCALISSPDRWNKVLHPAPVMHASKPPSPEAAFWTSHMLLLIARVIPAGSAIEPFIAPAVNSHGRTLTVSYRFLTPAPASSTINDYLGLAVPRSVPASVVFTENNHVVCRLRPSRGLWVSPAAAGR